MLFGMITQWFARYELLIHKMIATVSGSDATSIKLLTRGLSFAVKRDALFDLLRHRAVPLDRIDQVQKYLQILHTFTPLCNDIAHSAWIEVKPETSIRPAWLSHKLPTTIKAVHDIDGQSQLFVEDDQDRATYTLDELKKIVENLEMNYTIFHAYVREVGLVSSDAH